MTLFISILLKLIPLYLMIVLGFISARILKVQKESIAKLLIYIIAPIIIFYGSYTTEINLAILSLPLVIYFLCSFLAITFLYIWNIVFKKDSRKNIVAYSAWGWNTGYFWLPVISAILWEKAFSIAVMCILGFVLYENTIWFFITAKWNHTVKESLLKVVRLPTIYAFIVWLLLNYFNIQFGDIALTTIWYFKWAYTLLWMMIIGMWIACINFREIDYKFIFLTFLAKFIFWPVIILSIISIDKNYLNLFNSSIYNVLIIMSIVPLAANTVVLATELKVHPEKAALAVLLSTILALFYIPIMVSLFIK